MRTVKLITWNPQDEVYEMNLGNLTATHISSYDVSCTGDLHVGENLWVGDEFLTAAFIRSLKEPSEDLNLNTLKAHKVDILDNGDEKGRLGVSDVYLTDLYGTSATLGSADIDSITCTKITVGDLSLDRDVLYDLLNSTGMGDVIEGEKTFVDHVEFNDAYLDRYELGTGFVGGDMTVDANIIPETTTSWLGDNTHPWGAVCTQSLRNRWVENDVQHVGEILVYATTLKPDPNANVSGLGTSNDPWEVAYIQTLNVTEGLSCEGTGYISDILANTISCSGQADFNTISCSGQADFNTISCSEQADFNTISCSEQADFSQITCSDLSCRCFVADREGVTLLNSIIPGTGSDIRLGSTSSYFKGVFTTHISFGTGAIGSLGVSQLSMQGSLIPVTNAGYDLGRNSNRWRQIYTNSLQSSSVTLVSSNNIHQIIMEATSDLTISGFNNDCGLVLTHGVNYPRPPITCGKLYGELVSPEYVPTADHPEFPDKNEYTDPPLFTVAPGSIVMAIPCWATLRSLFGSPQPVGKIIDVVKPQNWETAQPFEHTTDYESDPEKGAWYYATFKPGTSGDGANTYEPLHTATGNGYEPNYAYLEVGKYKLLSCVSAYNSSYDDYMSNGYTGACLMLQRIS